MEHDNLTLSLLELIERPAFCIQNGTVVYANRSAQQSQILPGTTSDTLFPKGDTAYQQYTGGQLSLTVLAAGIPCKAQLTRNGGYDIFILDGNTPELRAIALTAQHLRNPLSTVMTVADQLSAENPEQVVQLSHLQRGLHQLHRLVCNMSDSYRYQHTDALRMEMTDISGVINAAMEAVDTQLGSCGIRLNYTGLNKAVIGIADREMLERAVYNLVSNAAKFMTDNSTLTARLSLNSNVLSFTVQNQTQSISNPFSLYIREPGAEDARRGIGLGMELVRAVAASHGGTVLVDQPDDNSFRVTMTISVTTDTVNAVRDTIHLPLSNYAGERNRSLLEFSEILPADAYKSKD
jgi:signal transduction histidine kinase